MLTVALLQEETAAQCSSCQVIWLFILHFFVATVDQREASMAVVYFKGRAAQQHAIQDATAFCCRVGTPPGMFGTFLFRLTQTKNVWP